MDNLNITNKIMFTNKYNLKNTGKVIWEDVSSREEIKNDLLVVRCIHNLSPKHHLPLIESDF
jgi:hypothetical protein